MIGIVKLVMNANGSILMVRSCNAASVEPKRQEMVMKVDITEKTAKAAAHRLRDALGRDVSHSTVLHAIATACGYGSWQAMSAGLDADSPARVISGYAAAQSKMWRDFLFLASGVWVSRNNPERHDRWKLLLRQAAADEAGLPVNSPAVRCEQLSLDAFLTISDQGLIYAWKVYEMVNLFCCHAEGDPAPSPNDGYSSIFYLTIRNHDDRRFIDMIQAGVGIDQVDSDFRANGADMSRFISTMLKVMTDLCDINRHIGMLKSMVGSSVVVQYDSGAASLPHPTLERRTVPAAF